MSSARTTEISATLPQSFEEGRPGALIPGVAVDGLSDRSIIEITQMNDNRKALVESQPATMSVGHRHRRVSKKHLETQSQTCVFCSLSRVKRMTYVRTH